MKKSKTTFLATTAVAFILMTLISGCKKDKEEQQDWASALEGLYTHDVITGGSTYHEITNFTVRRVSNTTISIKVERDGAGSFVSQINSCYDSVSLFNEYDFTFNESDGCSPGAKGIGYGSFTPNSIHMEWTSVPQYGWPPYDTDNFDFTATK
jgi:hypothetical protein